MAVAQARPAPTGSSASTKRRGSVSLAALVVLVALAYLWPFRLYGFEVVDEGTLLAQIDRATHGEQPYIDFETGYTPGYFAVETALWRASGSDIAASRTFGVFVHAGTALLVFAVARAFAGTLIALAATAVQLAFFLPVSLRFGAPFNVPYPGWFASALALAAQALVAAIFGRRGAAAAPRRAARLVVAGLAVGAVFSVKPNSGLFALGGAALAVASGWEAQRGGARAIAILLAGAAVLAAAALVLATADALSALALLAPVGLAALRVSTAAAPPAALARGAPGGARMQPIVDASSLAAPRTLGAALGDLAALAVGFASVVLPWLVPLAARLGIPRLLRDVFLLDGSVVRAFTVDFPAPEPATIVLGIALAGAAALVFAANEANRVVGELAALTVPWLLAGGLAAAALLAGRAGPRLAAENACLWLAPLGLVVGLVGVPRRSRYRGERALLCFAALYQLQIFPRSDLIHAAMSAPPVLVAVGATWARLARRWRTALRGAHPHERSRAPVLLRVTPLACAGVVLLLAAGRTLPTFGQRFSEPTAALDAGPRAPLLIDARYAADFAWLGETVRAVDALSASGDALFPFPDLAAIGFLARRPMPFRYIYFVPQRPDHDGERETIARLEELRPKLAVTGPPRVPAFRGADEYFAPLVKYLDEHYCPALETAQSHLLVRKPQGREGAPCAGA